jgi:hypothetical protein
LKALDLIKLSINMENSFRFSGRTSCPGGCDPEKILRYPLKISTVFSVILALMSLRDLSTVLPAAVPVISMVVKMVTVETYPLWQLC